MRLRRLSAVDRQEAGGILRRMSQPKPIKLSGELVEEARRSARLFHRSLTGQIEHWATIGRAVESQASGDALAQLLQRVGGIMKIGSVAWAGQRQQVAAVLSGLLAKPAGAADTYWLQEMRARGIPLYGTTGTQPGKVIRLEPNRPQAAVRAARPAG